VGIAEVSVGKERVVNLVRGDYLSEF